MADTLDLLTLTEAKAVLNPRTTAKDSRIEMKITAASRILDGLCGPIVYRTVTDELHQSPSGHLWLHQTPVVSITNVKEWASGTATALTAETNEAAGGYRFDARLGSIARRASWYDTSWSSDYVTVTYVAGRYADTASVDELFKEACAEIIRVAFKREQGAGTDTYGDIPDLPLGIPNGVRRDLADAGVLRAPVIA